MPTQSFDERTLSDLALLASLPPSAAEEFARIAVEFTLKGAREKPFIQAAKALAVELDTVRNCVAAISRVFLVCSKDNLSEKDLVASISSAELPEATLVALGGSYKSARAEMRELAKAGATQLPSFQGFDWRLDIEMSRRGAHHVAQPVYMLRLDSASAQATASDGDAAAAASTPGATSSMYLQSDYANLAQLHSALSDALQESTTQHASRVERYIR